MKDLALVDKNLKNLILNKNIFSNLELKNYIQPASLDIPLGDKAYLIKQKFLPFNKKVSEIVQKLTIEELNLTKGAILLKGQTYLVKCLDIDLPEGLSISTSPKSSIGRIDLMVRSIIDNSGLYDFVNYGSKGELWVEITPQSFNVNVKNGLSLNQLMVFKKSEYNIDFKNAKFIYDEDSNLIFNKVYKEKLILSLNVKENSLIGYEAIYTNEVIDLSKIGELNSKKFFRELRTENIGKLTLNKNRFYILYTKERISIPTKFSAEMAPFSHLIGELRAHYAGFFDPGFGYGNEGEITGSVGVLEIRPHETITVYNGQPICLMEFYKNLTLPEFSYGFSGNNYQSQTGPKLAKYFK